MSDTAGSPLSDIHQQNLGTALRDACIHGRYEAHNYINPPSDVPFIIVDWGDGSERCSGGRDITIDSVVECHCCGNVIEAPAFLRAIGDTDG